MSKLHKTYPLNQSPLFKLKSKKRLAQILSVDIGEIEGLTCADNYSLWDTKVKDSARLAGITHKPRSIQNPKPNLAAIQRKIAFLLSRIEKPHYLFSACKGKNHVKNAIVHAQSDCMLKIDIKSFYQSASFSRVRSFFLDDCQCSQDVAYILAKICSYKNHLPTGASTSPVISFFAYKSMFDEIDMLAMKYGLKATLYIDDIAISGPFIPGNLKKECLEVISSYGLVGHKISIFDSSQVKVVTGVAIDRGLLRLPYKRQMKIRKISDAFKVSSIPADKLILGKALIGQYREGSHIEKNLNKKALEIELLLSG